MQEVTKGDGRKFRELFQGKDYEDLVRMQKAAFARAVSEPDTVKVTQRRIGRNELCPCQSGLKFKACCMPKLRKTGHLDL